MSTTNESKSSKWKLGEDTRKLTSSTKTRRNCSSPFGRTCQKYRFRRSRSTWPSRYGWNWSWIPKILWNAIKATHTIVKQDNDKLTLFAAEAAYNNIKMRPDELPISYCNRIIQAIDMVKSRDVDVENDRNYTEDQRMLRMVKGLDPVRFGELQLTLDQNEKMG